MSATLITLADGVKDLLAAGTFSQELTVVRQYDTSQDLIDAADGYRVDVVPSVDTLEFESRGALRKEPAVDVALRYRFGPSHRWTATGKIKDAEIDVLLNLFEEVLAYLADRANRRIGGLVFMRAEIRVPWLPAHLREHGQYTGIAQVTYRAGVTT
jgi:hypothetical protein